MPVVEFRERISVRRTKIICTVGPATESVEMLHQIIEAGADVLRLNFSHGTPDQHWTLLKRIREVAGGLGKPVAVLQDLPGPKIRVGAFREGSIQLQAGERFTITTGEVAGDQHRVSVNYSRLADEVQAGQTLLLADGTIELEIEEVNPPEIHCRVVLGGSLSSHKGVTVPYGAINLPAFTDHDRELLLDGLERGVDMAAVSFVRSKSDIVSVRECLAARKADMPVMAKIEKPEALDVLDEILSVVDSIMVARGDLGVEIPLARVPLVQKDLIAKANRAGKPVVTATQMLRSMVESPRPTRAEAADVANAVLDGSDALMLSEESAVGAYPVEAVKILAEIAERAEERFFARRSASLPAMGVGTSEAIGHAACLVALETEAAAIICCTRTGRTAQWVAKHRPATPIIAVSPRERTVRSLMVTWGVHPTLSEEFETADEMVEAALEAARGTALIASGQKVVVVGGEPDTPLGETNFLRVAIT